MENSVADSPFGSSDQWKRSKSHPIRVAPRKTAHWSSVVNSALTKSGLTGCRDLIRFFFLIFLQNRPRDASAFVETVFCFVFFCYNNKKKLGKTRSGESGVRRRVGESLAFCLFVCLFRSRRRRRRLAKKKLGRKNPVRSGSRGRTLEEEEKRWQNKRIVNPNWVNEVQRHAKKKHNAKSEGKKMGGKPKKTTKKVPIGWGWWPSSFRAGRETVARGRFRCAAPTRGARWRGPWPWPRRAAETANATRGRSELGRPVMTRKLDRQSWNMKDMAHFFNLTLRKPSLT